MILAACTATSVARLLVWRRRRQRLMSHSRMGGRGAPNSAIAGPLCTCNCVQSLDAACKALGAPVAANPPSPTNHSAPATNAAHPGATCEALGLAARVQRRPGGRLPQQQRPAALAATSSCSGAGGLVLHRAVPGEREAARVGRQGWGLEAPPPLPLSLPAAACRQLLGRPAHCARFKIPTRCRSTCTTRTRPPWSSSGSRLRSCGRRRSAGEPQGARLPASDCWLA